MPGLAHLYIGEEAVAVGVCGALRQDDYITSTHRGHGHCLAKGAAPDKMFAELLGKEAGYCRGKGVRLVHATAQKFVERARRGDGPAFLECHTYRFHGHHVGDIDRAYYRSKAEEQEWQSKRDPLNLCADWLKQCKMADDKFFQALENEVSAEIQTAVNFALNAPYPPANEVDQHVYA